jgi:hypothetical protein
MLSLVILGVFALAAFTVITVARIASNAHLRKQGFGPISAGLEERVARLEHTIEGLAAENQRLVDGQRFFTQLLAQRPAPPAIAAPRGGDEGQDGAKSPRR